MAADILVIILTLIITQAFFVRDFSKGMAAAVFFLILLPTETRLPTGGALPEVTVHRLLLILCAWHVFRLPQLESGKTYVPGIALMGLVALSRFASTTTAIDVLRSTKDMLSFFLETFLYYVVIARALRNRETVLRVVWAIMLASVLVAFDATLEKYRGINIAARIIPGMVQGHDVTATYRHRILLGYAMALALPLAMALRSWSATPWQKRLAWTGILMTPAACYFGNSRGPWVGMALSCAIMGLFGSKLMRKQLITMGVLACVVLLAKPGVYETIHNRWEATKTTDSLKGRSASYRLELWKVAWRHLTESPARFAVGFGGQSTEIMQLGQEMEFGGGSTMLGHTSWDSEYAADFMKYGAFGLLSEIMLYLAFLMMCFQSWRSATPVYKELMIACLAVVAVYLWAMSNVAIFNPQLEFLFWTVVAVAVRAPYIEWEEAPALESADEAMADLSADAQSENRAGFPVHNF